MFKNLLLIVIVLVVCEFALRLCGIQPFSANQWSRDAWTKEDALLGWSNSPGQNQWLNGSYPERPFKVTVWPDGSRATAAKQELSSPEILILGGSYTFGWVLDDNESFPWLLQDQYPNFSISNHAVGGFGTFQSEILMDKLLESEQSSPSLILYGLNEHHELRNIGHPEWQAGLSSGTSEGNIRFPYCVPWESPRCSKVMRDFFYPALPLRNYLSLVRLIEEVYARINYHPDLGDGRVITKAILSRMNTTAKRYGARFVVLGLRINNEAFADYEQALAKSDVELVDCNHQPFTSGRISLVHEHPTAETHRFWAECVASVIDTY